MKEILETIIKNLVSDKNAVSINEIQTDSAIKFEVKVAESDVGRIIGKQGKVAKAIRTLLKAVASKEKKKVTIEFMG